MNDIIIKIQVSLKILINWIEKNGWVSYDPNDVKGHPFFIALLSKQNFFKKLLLFPLYSIYIITPVTLRYILKIKPTITPGGMGFLAAGYIELYKATKDTQNLKKAKQILGWLKNNRIDRYKDYCWGFPFDWQSTVLIPKNTPITYTTVECVKPFVEYYKITKDKDYLNVAISACKFIDKNIDKKQHSNNGISFSYTPLDDAEVINSNAIVASVLLEVGQIAGIKEFIEIADKIILFVLAEQLSDGSWYYFSRRYKNGSSIIDNYHTAMVLQSLTKIILLKGDSKKRDTYAESLIKGLKFYLDNFFTSKGIPKITPDKVYPINIASCAEAITLFSQVDIVKREVPPDLFRRIQEVNKKLILWTIDNMQDPNGAFIERKYSFKKIKLYSIRWGQAFMLRSMALSLLFFTSTTKNGTN
ncbi:MAG: hypothetical protein PHN37_01475 [Candidatus Pacebacteria bacterium]|nr:hypothetical protein [Candidatus Paceibacterota bacterium]